MRKVLGSITNIVPMQGNPTTMQIIYWMPETFCNAVALMGDKAQLCIPHERTASYQIRKPKALPPHTQPHGYGLVNIVCHPLFGDAVFGAFVAVFG